MLARGLTVEADLSAFLSDFKRETGWHFRKHRHRRLWQEGFRDRLLRDEAEALSILAYIVANPVRAGLVTSAVDYEFWGSLTSSREAILKRLGLP